MKPNHPAIQTFVATLAAVVSIVAAAFAWYQVEVSNKHNRLSVMPALQITPYMEGKAGRNGLYLSNDGLGPAIVKDFSVGVDGILASGTGSNRWGDVFSTVGLNHMCFATGWPKGETTLKAGVEVPLVILTKAEGAEVCYLELVKMIGGKPIEITINYESVYGEKKQLAADTRFPAKGMDTLYQGVVRK